MDRRTLLTSVIGGSGVTISGCLQWASVHGGDDADDEPKREASPLSVSLLTDLESRYDDEENPLVEGHNHRVSRQMIFTAINLEGPSVRSDASGRGEGEPATIDLRIANDADHPRTLDVDGYLPITGPRSSWQRNGRERSDLVLLPDYYAVSHDLDFRNIAPEYVEEGEYWIPDSTPDPPEITRTVTLDPGEAIGGRHVLLAPRDESKRLSRGWPAGGSYGFESEITVTPADERTKSGFEFEYGFAVDVSLYSN